MHVISCASYLGRGGLGQHFAQLVREQKEHGVAVHIFGTGADSPGEEFSRVRMNYLDPLFRYTPIRFSLQTKDDISSAQFDRIVARNLPGELSSFTGFVGKSLRSFQTAKSAGCKRLRLVAANSHVDNVARLHEQAAEDTGIRDSWLSKRQIVRTKREYELADEIVVHSEYVRRSFVERGVDPSRIVRMHMEIDPRFVPAGRVHRGKPFVVAYAGRVDATKGIPLLIDAFSKLPSDNAILRIVGGWSNRAMKKFMQHAIATNDRIIVKAGDPLPVLQDANVFVHPSYEDGFAYGPAEALSCGLPVVVTEETGMKELVDDGITGNIIPAGDSSAILECLKRYLRQHYAEGGI